MKKLSPPSPSRMLAIVSSAARTYFCFARQKPVSAKPRNTAYLFQGHSFLSRLPRAFRYAGCLQRMRREQCLAPSDPNFVRRALPTYLPHFPCRTVFRVYAEILQAQNVSLSLVITVIVHVIMDQIGCSACKPDCEIVRGLQARCSKRTKKSSMVRPEPSNG